MINNERTGPTFDRNDHIDSWYELAKKYIFGFLLLAIPLRFIIVFTCMFAYYIWFISWEWMHKRNIVSFKVKEWMVQTMARHGSL